MNPFASIIISAALVFYSIGVWSERIQGRLKTWHLAFFYTGFDLRHLGDRHDDGLRRWYDS